MSFQLLPILRFYDTIFGHRNVANEMKTQQGNLIVNYDKSVVDRHDQVGWTFDLIKQTEIERAQLSRLINTNNELIKLANSQNTNIVLVLSIRRGILSPLRVLRYGDKCETNICLIWARLCRPHVYKTISPRRSTRSLCAGRESSGAYGSIIEAFSMRYEAPPHTHKRAKAEQEYDSFGLSLRGGVADDVECWR